MVAHFAELHEDVYYRHEMTAGQRFPGSVNQRETKLIKSKSLKYLKDK